MSLQDSRKVEKRQMRPDHPMYVGYRPPKSARVASKEVVDKRFALADDHTKHVLERTA
jgi:hypothetical protein